MLLDSSRDDRDVIEGKLDHRLSEEARLLPVRIEQYHVPIGPRDGQRNARNAAARSYVEHAQARVCGKPRQNGERIFHVEQLHLRPLPDRREVVDAIPFRQQIEIKRESRACPGGKRARNRQSGRWRESALGLCQRRARHLDGVSARRTVSSARGKPRFKCTSRSDTAAGVTPDSRAAWPRVSGLRALSFCWTSIDNPRTRR